MFDTTTEGRTLTGHVVKSYVVRSQGDCELKCYLEDECMSINFGPEDRGTHLCELSDSDHDLHPRDLTHRHSFIYIATEVKWNHRWLIMRLKNSFSSDIVTIF